jgi:NhaA family Na+:H+ antiporter
VARPSELPSVLPREPVDRLLEPFMRFVRVQASGGVALLAATAIALVAANSPLAHAWHALWETSVTLGLGHFVMRHSLEHWVSDGLMTIFFFVIGLEVKREVVSGQLRELRAASLPIAAALGGMLAPAAVYLALQWGEPTVAGWGIPMATDIAFVVGCLAVLGSRVPPGLRVLLVSLAIADDIGAILVIAIGYSKTIHLPWLALGGVGMLAVWALAQLGVRSIPMYVIAGFGVWLGFHESGVHATLAGVILGLMTPHRSWVGGDALRESIARAGAFLHGEREDPQRLAVLGELKLAAREATSPLERLEHALHPWQSFAIVPLFALANAGVAVKLEAFADPVALAVAAGLVVGKPVGILAASWLAVRAGMARLPPDLSWPMVAGGGCLAGIGFTMSIFIASLALEDSALAAAKLGILVGSLVSGVLGMSLLLRCLPRRGEASA